MHEKFSHMLENVKGISEETIQNSDYIVKLPMDGFVPSYNLQVAVSVLAVEALRQRKS